MNAPDPHATLAAPEKFAELLARTREPFPASRKAYIPVSYTHLTLPTTPYV